MKYRKTSENKRSDNLSFNYYIEQFHRISIEQQEISSKELTDSEVDDDLLDFFARVLRLLRSEGETYIDAFILDTQKILGADLDKTYPALQRMQSAGLIAINQGKVMLTDSGREMVDEH